MDDRESSSSLEVLLHPLVILNMSDHFTRHRVVAAQNNAPMKRVIGALMGTQNGRNVEFHTSFELLYDVVDGNFVIDKTFLKTKSDQYVKVFPTYEVLGWYSTGGHVDESDHNIHRQFAEVNENPLLLLLNTSVAADQRDLPATVYESVLHVVGDAPTFVFSKLSYKIETGEAERIAVDHVAHLTSSGAGVGGSSLVGYFGGMQNAVKMLHLRIQSIQKFLDASARGEIALDHHLLRQVASLVHQLPAMDSPKFASDFTVEYNDTMIVTYLATITKGSQQLQELLEKFQLAYESKQQGGQPGQRPSGLRHRSALGI